MLVLFLLLFVIGVPLLMLYCMPLGHRSVAAPVGWDIFTYHILQIHCLPRSSGTS